jgi:choline dehydrogenase-like flavoprotein
LIRPEYDIVIIGSGYGGGVAASRFARAGKSVCVLEKGAEVLAGQFPHTLKGALRESSIRDIRPRRHGTLGKASALYQTYKGNGQDVFTGSGLGGTSLINAGVFLRADRKILGGPEWPVEIRENIDDLSQCKERFFVVANVISPCVAGLIVNRL